MPLFFLGFSEIFYGILGWLLDFFTFFKLFFRFFMVFFMFFLGLHGIILRIWWDITKNYGTFCSSQEIPPDFQRRACKFSHNARLGLGSIGIHWNLLASI
jgi:hypothetical protein